MEDTIKRFIFDMKEQLMLFQLLGDEEVECIIPYFEIVSYHAGTTLYNEGEVATSIGFIISGLLEVKKKTEFEGRQIVLGTLGKGSFIGEMSLINTTERRSSSVVALEDTEIVTLERKEFDILTEKYPHIGVKILRGLNQILAIRLRKTVERLAAVF